MIRVRIEPSFEAFRAAARPLLRDGVRPEHVDFEDRHAVQTALWQDAAETPNLREASGEGRHPAPAGAEPRLPGALLRQLEIASWHRDADRFSLFYRIAYRVVVGERSLLVMASDPDVSRLRAMVRAVEHDEHRMHAFVRFRRAEIDGREHFVAWHAPDHPIVRRAAPFFRDRFGNMRWSILTPDESVHWDGEALRYSAGVPSSAAPSGDEFEELFLAYYKAIFNPARLNLSAMRAHMPARHWATLPETRVVSEIVRGAPELVRGMRAPLPSAALSQLPADGSLPSLRAAAAACTACPLYENASQTVFGEGSANAKLMLVGEQPGDEEDRGGLPFIGPAGKVLDRALEQARLDRNHLYLTNAVKHFKWKGEGPRRLHDRPRPGEVRACRAWLDAEISAVRPQVIVCLGATAAQSFLGARFSVARYRGHWFETPWAKSFVVTYHPAAILRMPDPAATERAFADLVLHLVAARERLEGTTPSPSSEGGEGSKRDLGSAVLPEPRRARR